MTDVSRARGDAIEGVRVAAYTIPTDRPESDGTLEWDSTTIVVVELHAGERVGLGYTYADAAVAHLIERVLGPVVIGRDPLAIPQLWMAMVRAVRNLGRPGVASTAIAAVDTALWDLKARLLQVPLVSLLGSARAEVAVYGSGGFTSYTDEELAQQLSSWADTGISSVKMKVGREPQRDPARVRLARDAIGTHTQLFVDANGAYDVKEALSLAEEFTDAGVTWFEEPVSSDDLDGLARIRDRAPWPIEVAAGEYGYDLAYFARMLSSGAVDVLQADATRCAGITGLLQLGPLCEAAATPLSAHTAPALHLHLGCAMNVVRHLEYFHDHVRIERMLFDGAIVPVDGMLRPDLSRSGLGLDIKRTDAAPYLVYGSVSEAA